MFRPCQSEGTPGYLNGFPLVSVGRTEKVEIPEEYTGVRLVCRNKTLGRSSLYYTFTS